jgi:hypothetical protein
MNPQFRTVAIVAASLGLLVSLFFALRPSDDDETAPGTSSQITTTAPATTSSTTTPATTPAPTPSDVVKARIVVRKGSTDIRRLSVKQGHKVELVVTSEIADEVHLHGYDLMADVAAGEPVTIRFTADTPGVFEIELEDLGLQIAELEVRP